MLAAFGLTAAMLPQIRIRLSGAVAADEMDRHFGAKLLMQHPDVIDQLGVHLGLFFDPPIAHESVEALERVLVVFAVLLEGDGDGLFGVNVEHDEGAGFTQSACTVGCGRPPRRGGQKHEPGA